MCTVQHKIVPEKSYHGYPKDNIKMIDIVILNTSNPHPLIKDPIPFPSTFFWLLITLPIVYNYVIYD